MRQGRRHRILSCIAWLTVAIACLFVPRTAIAGYTHYWHWHRAPDAAQLRAALDDMRTIARARSDLVVMTERADGITVNGIGKDAFEDFSFPGALPRASDPPEQRGFNFTKTQWRPYDVVVTACLLAARAHFSPEVLDISSDGEDADWQPGRELYGKVLGRAPPPLLLRAGEGAYDAPPSASQPSPLALSKARRAPSDSFSQWLYPLIVLGALAFFFGRSRDGESPMSYYAFWYLAPLIISFVMARPLLLLAIPIGIVARPWLPNPILWLQTFGRVRKLEAEIGHNRANITARRDLAKLLLSIRRGSRAREVVEEALARDGSLAELHYLKGLALVRIGRRNEGIAELAETVSLEPRFGYGEPYLRVGDALVADGRWDDAEDALERFVDVHGGSVEGWYKLAYVRTRRGDEAGAKKALAEAKAAFRYAKGSQRTAYLGWYVRALVRGVLA